MKKLLVILLSSFSLLAHAQRPDQRAGYVDRVLNVPVFMYAYPDAPFTEVTELTATWSLLLDSPECYSSVNERVTEIVRRAKRRERKGRIGQFDALVIHPDDFTGVLIRFDEGMDLRSQAFSVDGVPVFMYAQPDRDYQEVRRMSATWSAISTGLDGDTWVDDRVDEIVRKALRKRRKGKVGNFDAIIIDPDSFSGTLIRYN